MPLHGQQIIAGQPSASSGEKFQANNPALGQPLDTSFGEATASQVDAAFKAAAAAFDELRTRSAEDRAKLLDTIADELDKLGDELLQRAHAETALPLARLTGEKARTIMQTRLFAQMIREGSWLEARIDRGNPERKPLPKPDVRRMMQPIGPVAVFGASNFPFAISVVGTDTTCALAAGCPVVVKAHPGHPGTCEMLGEVVVRALQKCNMPAGAFSLLHGRSTEVGMAMVKHPVARAVAFTGSLIGGRALFYAACSREEPIPFYGEMGSVNPVFLLPGALKQRAKQIAEGYVQSVTMGVGQFCTNPGLVFGLDSAELSEFIDSSAGFAQQFAPSTMLHAGICHAFHAGVDRLAKTPGVKLAAHSNAKADLKAAQASAVLFVTDGANYEAQHSLNEEVFGPTSVISRCSSAEQLYRIAEKLQGSLTATIHGTPEDLAYFAPLVRTLEKKVGRIIFNGFPTGIEVCSAMHHGGPYPATTHSFFTSIGTASIYRFVRPVAYQGFPDAALPPELQSANPRQIWRLVDNQFTKEPC
jgi:NADP-dependent aldehyde dehydrogenase